MGSHSDGLGTVQGISDPSDLLAASPGKRKHLGYSIHAGIYICYVGRWVGEWVWIRVVQVGKGMCRCVQ